MQGDIIKSWLDTFSPVETIAASPQAMALEIEAITRIFERDGADRSLIDAAFQRIKETSQSRAWPTAAMCFDALKQVKMERTGDMGASPQGGDRLKLTSFELAKLDGFVLPTARRWLRERPNLRHHAIATLTYWGEALVDDRGRSYEGKGRA